MRLTEEEYGKRLAGYADSTIQLISDLLATDRETTRRMGNITTNSEYTEEDVVRLLLQLKKEVTEGKG